jgi:hypothetical protein
MKFFLATLLRGSLVASVLALGLLAVSSVRAAEAEDKGEHFVDVPVPEGLSASDVKEAIVATLLGRQWGVKSKSDSEVVGYLKHRSNEATVTMVYDNSKVGIYSVGFAINKKTGERKKPEQPLGWLKNLQQDLVRHLNTTITQK